MERMRGRDGTELSLWAVSVRAVSFGSTAVGPRATAPLQAVRVRAAAPSLSPPPVAEGVPPCGTPPSQDGRADRELHARRPWWAGALRGAFGGPGVGLGGLVVDDVCLRFLDQLVAAGEAAVPHDPAQGGEGLFDLVEPGGVWRGPADVPARVRGQPCLGVLGGVGGAVSRTTWISVPGAIARSSWSRTLVKVAGLLGVITSVRTSLAMESTMASGGGQRGADQRPRPLSRGRGGPFTPSQLRQSAA